MKRRKAREKAFQILFQIDINDINSDDAIDYFAEEEPIDSFTSDLVKGVMEHKETIDHIISEQLTGWSLMRIASVERTLLRLAVYEIKYLDSVPDKVAINEAIELAKAYGDDGASKFINGVLSKIVNQHES
jgi:transcription antitermination protein NusB